MIVQCPHCDEFLRLDKTGPLQPRSLEVKCPKCFGEGFFLSRTKTSRETCEDCAVETKLESSNRKEPKSIESESSDFTIPEDAFNSFRFPAEEKSVQNHREGMDRKRRLTIFVGASILVVAIFAAVVNLVLPGPSPYKLENTGLPVDADFHENSKAPSH